MIWTSEYMSPLGRITLACDDEALVGLWFNGQRYFGSVLPKVTVQREHPLFAEAGRWLDIYFSGKEPGFLPPLRYDTTPFRKRICDIMLTIPYGKTMTYGEIAAEAARQQGLAKMSAQAVGGAVSAGSSVDVYATGSAATQALARGVSVLATSAGTDDRQASGSASKVTWVTLAVDPNQVEELVSAAQKTELYLTLPGADAR